MRKMIFAALAALAVTTSPILAKDNNGNNGNGNTTNHGGYAEGGHGGAGGSGTGVGVAVAGAAAGAVASGGSASATTGAVRNDNTNLNTVSTLGINSSSNEINNAVRNTVGNSLGNVTAEGSSASTANANNSTVTVEGDNYRRNPVHTAYSAPLVAGSDTCMGSTTMGAQSSVFGISFGSTWTDKNCVRLKNSRELVELGHKDAAVQLLCTDKEVKAAMRAAGTPCKS